jgi:osmoprotectant transport system ATP-binding protein
MVRTGLQADLRRIFRSLGTTVVMVTHDLREAAYFADRIVLMREGAIVQIGSLEDFARSPADPFVTVFLTAQRGPADGSGRDVPELGALPDARTGPIGGDPA